MFCFVILIFLFFADQTACSAFVQKVNKKEVCGPVLINNYIQLKSDNGTEEMEWLNMDFYKNITTQVALSGIEQPV